MNDPRSRIRILVACEFSGVVRDAFLARGFTSTWSCDLLPSEGRSLGHWYPEHYPVGHAFHYRQQHYQGDVFDVLDGPAARSMALEGQAVAWDAMLFFWPCTYLCNSGVRWLYGGKGTVRDPVRWAKMEADARSFKRLLNWPGIRFKAGENPIQHRYAREIIGRGPDQIIQPWQFGHGEIKATGFWLEGFPPLVPTDIVPAGLGLGRVPRVHHASPGPDRWKERSRFLAGVANAMADQWGAFLLRQFFGEGHS